MKNKSYHMPLGPQRLINVPKTCGPPDQGTDRSGICKIFLPEVSKFFSVALRSSPKVDFCLSAGQNFYFFIHCPSCSNYLGPSPVRNWSVLARESLALSSR